MIGYLDTSALVPLFVPEPGSGACLRFVNDADDVVSSRLTYVEVAAALARAQRMGRLTGAELDSRQEQLDQLWETIAVVDMDEPLARRAAVVARRFGLRSYDAVHCATAECLDEQGAVAASGDQALLRAWEALGMATFDVDGPA